MLFQSNFTSLELLTGVLKKPTCLGRTENYINMICPVKFTFSVSFTIISFRLLIFVN